MKHLRPHRIFNLLEEKDRMAWISLPFQHSVTSMLERGILMSLLKVVQPRTVFEFGTYLGEMTRMFAENCCARIFTLDLGAGFSSGKLDDYEQKNLSQSLRQQKMFYDSEHRDRIIELFGDSTTFDFTPWLGTMEFILIDGGHHIDVVRSDTENALKLISPHAPGCIVWHDYLNPVYEITGFLDTLSETLPLFHVEETKYVFYLSNNSKASRLLD